MPKGSRPFCHEFRHGFAKGLPGATMRKHTGNRRAPGPRGPGVRGCQILRESQELRVISLPLKSNVGLLEHSGLEWENAGGAICTTRHKIREAQPLQCEYIVKYCDRGSRFQPLRPPRDLLARPGGEPPRGLARILHGQSQSPVSSRGEAPRDKQYCKGRKLRGSD